MRNTLLIAGREYAENARTKGFWINLLIFPLILIASVKVPELLEKKAKPVRNFVLVDQSGEFEEAVASGVERFEARRVLQELTAWAMANRRRDLEIPEVDLEDVPATGISDLLLGGSGSTLEGLIDLDPGFLQRLLDPEGLEQVVAAIRPFLDPEAPDFVPPKRRFERVPLLPGVSPDAPPEEIVRTLKPYLVDEDYPGASRPLFALILIPEDAPQQLLRPGSLPTARSDSQDGVQFWSANLTDRNLAEVVRDALDREVREREFLRRGVDAEVVAEVQRTSVRFVAFDPTKQEGEEAVSLADTIRKWAPVGFVYLLWIAIFNVVVMLLNNTVEEKSNRIIEVLVSSATPNEIMAGKLVGIAGVGLTMMAAWILSLVGILNYLAGPAVSWAGPLLAVVRSSGLLPLFALYFLAGYLTYAGLFLAIGSLCNTVKEAQNFMGTAMVILMVPLFTMVFIAQDPNGTLAKVMSWIPFYTPFVMMNRAAASPPTSELIGTGVLMVFTVFAMLWLSGKVFRIGILRTGQPPRLLELVKSLRTPRQLR